MKFDISEWTAVANETDFTAGPGVVKFWSNRANSVVTATAEGKTFVCAICHNLSPVSVRFAQQVTLRFVGMSGASPTPAYAHQYAREAASFEEVTGEVFTNIDRMTQESGTILEIKSAMRQFEIQRRNALAALQAERDALLPPPNPTPEETALEWKPDTPEGAP